MSFALVEFHVAAVMMWPWAGRAVRSNRSQQRFQEPKASAGERRDVATRGAQTDCCG